MTQATLSNVIERELFIEAAPATVFAFLTDPAKMVQWMGRSAIVEAQPGGLIRVDYNGFDVMRGTIVEVVPNERLVHTFGWESLSADAQRPGETTVEYTLTPSGNGTVLRLVHKGLNEAATESHAEGWDSFLAPLAQAAAGHAVQTHAPLTAGEEYASRLNTLLIQLVGVVEQCPPGRWKAATPNDGRAVNAVADHAAGHVILASVATDIAAGRESQIAHMTGEMLDEMNAARALEAANITPASVIANIRATGPAAVDQLKALDDAALAKAMPMAMWDGAPVSARAVIEGALLGSIEEHLAALRAVAGVGVGAA